LDLRNAPVGIGAGRGECICRRRCRISGFRLQPGDASRELAGLRIRVQGIGIYNLSLSFRVESLWIWVQDQGIRGRVFSSEELAFRIKGRKFYILGVWVQGSRVWSLRLRVWGSPARSSAWRVASISEAAADSARLSTSAAAAAATAAATAAACLVASCALSLYSSVRAASRDYGAGCKAWC